LAEDESLKVALVDADLRSARRRLPEVDPGSGFPGVLAGSQAVERALVGTSLPNFMVLPGGVPTDTPQRLCTAENCRPILEHLKRHYHFVIIDGAPILEAPETTALASQVDGTILVVRASRTKREVVQRAMNTIEKFQGRVLGAILNRQQYVIPEFIYRRI
jgi:Mrp family chromosome partitioning ATPase